MYPVVMYHFPNFFPGLFSIYFPNEFLLKKVKNNSNLTNILGFSGPFLGVSVLETCTKL